MDEQLILDTYTVIRKIGEGSGGIVFLAYHNRLKKQVVLKQIKNNIKSRREVDILKNLSHSYLPQVLDLIEYDGKVYTVMSYIEGKSFQDLVNEGYHFSQKELIKYGKQLCEALSYLHSQNPAIIHSDIKPNNIMLTPQGNICLIDFNISFYLDGSTILGYTNGYSSPEQSAVKTSQNRIVIDEKSDIYSVGATFYYLITHQKIIDNHPNIELLYNYTTEALAGVIAKAIRYDKKERYKNASAMLRAFDSVPKRDKRYLKLIRNQKILNVFFIILMGLSIILCGLGIRNNKIDIENKYNSLVTQQIEYRKKKDIENEEKVHKQAIELIPSALESYFQNALMYFESEEYQKCIDFINYDILENKKADLLQKRIVDCYDLLGKSYYELKMYDNAILAYENIFNYDEFDADYYIDYAIALAYNGQNQETESILEKAIEKGVKDDSIYYLRAEINYSQNQYNQALNNLNKCINESKNIDLLERVYILKSDIYNQQNNLIKSQEVLKQGYSKLPEDKKMLILERLIQVDIDLGNQMNQSNYQYEAISYLQKVIDNHWDTYQTYDNLVILNQKLGQYDQVNQYIQTMREKYGDDYNIFKRLAFMEVELQDRRNINNRNYSLFKKYYEKAKSMYNKDNDNEMALLDELYIRVCNGGW